MFILRRSYIKTKTKKTIVSSGKCITISISNDNCRRYQSNDKGSTNSELINTTILLESGYNVTELPVVIRKLKNLAELDKTEKELPKNSVNSANYNLIQEEFKQCLDLREVFALITKCTKISPNIALAAIERIYDLEANSSYLPFDTNTKDNFNVCYAKDAILDKLLKVVMKTEDTQTILNILKTNSTMIVPYKNKFCDELLLRVTDNKLSVNQLYEFAIFLGANNENVAYTQILDKLWVGFTANETNINEINIGNLFSILNGLKVSKKAMIMLLEQKFTNLWPKIKLNCMLVILEAFIKEKYFSIQSYEILGKWFFLNIHAFDEDVLLEIITKFTILNYTDNQIEGALEKYMKLKGQKVKSYILVICILNHCVKFKIRNEQILNTCCDHYLENIGNIPVSFIKSFVYPLGFLNFKPLNQRLWQVTEAILLESYQRVNIEDLSSIILSYIYVREYPIKLVTKVFHPEYLTKMSNSDLLQKLYLIDTALSIECVEYVGPLLPKDQSIRPVSQEQRINTLVNKMKDVFVGIFGENRVSTAVLVPNYCSDENFLIDIMIHPIGLGSDTFNWKLKTNRNENIAFLIHLTDHYCNKSKQLIGPQEMKKRHLELLGFQVVSLKYSVISELYWSYKNEELRKYLIDSIK